MGKRPGKKWKKSQEPGEDHAEKTGISLGGWEADKDEG